MEVDVLEFVVPVENNKTVFVWNIEPSLSEAHLYDRLCSVFSSFGPLYLVKVSPNPPPHAPGFSALVKFFSALQAAAAQRLTDGHSLFQMSPLKVRLSSKQMPDFRSNSARPLSHAHCLDLANYCLGFNGWTSDIITLKELTNEEEDGGEGEEREAGLTWRRLKFGCILQLNFPRHGRSTRGAAVVEDSFTYTDPGVYLQKRSQLQKRVRDRALVQAFSTVLLILLEGKVMVEVKQTSEQWEPDLSGLLQVNEFSWSSFDPDEDEGEDEEWDLTVS